MHSLLTALRIVQRRNAEQEGTLFVVLYRWRIQSGNDDMIAKPSP